MATVELTSYLPSAAELVAADVTRVRSRLAAFMASSLPDVDTRPGSVFGDLVLTPLAQQVTALEVAASRMFSDLDLGNVANGVIYNCDFVKEFIKNFNTEQVKTLRAAGLVRITFSSDTSYVIDRRTQFLFNGTSIFKIRLEEVGHLAVHPVGTQILGSNNYVLSQLADGQFFIDVPVVGTMTDQVVGGAAGTTDNLMNGMTGIRAVFDFSAGLPELGVIDLARLTRTTFYSASLATRGGAMSYILREFPDVKMVSPVLSGDAESVRDTLNALGIRSGSMDLRVRTSSTFATQTQRIRLNYVNLQDGDTVDAFLGDMNLAHVPVFIDSIVPSTSPTQINPTIYSRSGSARAQLATAAYSRLEKLFVRVPMPRDIDTNPLIERNTDDDGDFAYFDVTYRYDPMLETVAGAVESSSVRPVGVDVLAAGFQLVHVKKLTINFTKSPGKLFNYAQALGEVVDRVNGAGYPDILTEAALSDSVLYAGGSGVRSFVLDAEVRWSVANRFVPSGSADPMVDFAAYHAASRVAPVLEPETLAECYSPYLDPDLGEAGETLVAKGPRSIGFILDETNLVLSDASL